MSTRQLLIFAPLLVMNAAAQTTNVGSSLLEYSGTQNTNGWSYGYYNRSSDGDATYSGTEFQLMPGNGSSYALGGNPPWTSIGNGLDAHPNSTANGGEHWVVRRYTVGAGESGAFDINWLLRKSNPNCGDGVTGYLFHNGTQVDSATIAFNDSTGVFRKASIPTVNVGDTIDLMLSPNDPGNDGCDGSQFMMDLNRINTYPGLATTTQFANSVTDFGNNTNGWTYGYYDITANGAPDAGDFIPFNSSSWNGSIWDLNPAASGPWTEVTAVGGHPNGTNSAPGAEQWVTRRYTIQPGEDGDVMVEWDVAKGNPFGGGTSVHILWNGVEVGSTGVRGSDTLGFSGKLALADLEVGDTIDIALAPQGLDAQLFGSGDNGDGSDASLFSMRLYSIPEPATGLLAFASAGLLLMRRRR